jgi:glutaminyl-peptide cyclotransferase
MPSIHIFFIFLQLILLNNMRNKIIIFLIAAFIAAFIYMQFFNTNKPDQPNDLINFPQAKAMTITAVDTFEHDTTSYTEGLEFYKGNLYESAGENGKSFLVKYSPNSTTKPLLPKVKIDPKIFAEGITILNDTIYQLTYQSNLVLLYNANTLQKIGELPWLGIDVEGWGITNNGTQLIANTGSNIIYFLNPKNLKIEKTINVKLNGQPLDSVNEMEFVDGFIYANVYTTDDIVKIDAANGNVVAIINLNNLLPNYNASAVDPKQGNYLNGIAYKPTSKTFFITGKNWPKIFEVKFNN